MHPKHRLHWKGPAVEFAQKPRAIGDECLLTSFFLTIEALHAEDR